MPRITTPALAASLVLFAAGCGGDDARSDSKPAAKAPAIQEGKVLFSDDFSDNRNKWLTVEDLVSFEGGEYIWLQTPEGAGGFSMPDTLLEVDMPPGTSSSIDVEMTSGAANRGLTCLEHDEGGEDLLDWYELGVDGRRALIRRMKFGIDPKVLASPELPIANGRRVRLTAQCVRDGDAVQLALQVDGKVVATARDEQGVTGKPGTSEVYGYRRPDAKGSADMIWDDFELREATLG